MLILIFGLACKLSAQTSNQIKQAKEFIKNTGMTESEVISKAKARGLKKEQIDKVLEKDSKTLKKDNSLKSKSNKSKLNELDNITRVDESNILHQSENPINNQDISINNDELEIVDKDDDDVLKLDPIDKTIENLQYFGYNIFERDPALFQATTVGAVDPNYLIGPGDEIIFTLWGETQFRELLKVNREGFIFIPEVGQVFVNGLNLTLLESKLFRVLSKSYNSLNPRSGSATTFLDVSLGNLRPLRIQVLGEVAQPGAYTVSPSATLFSSLYYFNGPTTLGSLREIQLIRGGENVGTIDFYNYLLTGKKPDDERLQIDDVIYIPKRKKTISIFGEVNKPGIYELRNGETFKHLIEFAGQLKNTAYTDRIQIDRIVPFEERKKLGMDRVFVDVDFQEILSHNTTLDLKDGDKIQVFSIFDVRSNVVQITGAIHRPGSYDLGKGLRLSELIEKADNLLGDSYMDRVDVVRIKPDFKEELLKLNLSKVMEKDSLNDISLKGLDRVKIYSLTEMIAEDYVGIDGHVKNPGRYPLQENMTLYDLLFKAEGLLDIDYRRKTYLERADLIRVVNSSNKKEIIPFNLQLISEKKGLFSLKLKPNDLVKIYSRSEIEGDIRYVSIDGHVKYPGTYELFEENMKITDLIFKSGGFEDPIHFSNTYLERADLIRFDDDFIEKKLITFNLQDLIKNKNDIQNIFLQPGDHVKIYSKKVFNDSKPITVLGAIEKPGNYPFRLNMTLLDVILNAGGVSKNVYKYKVEIARINPKVLNENKFAESFVVELDNNFNLIHNRNENENKTIQSHFEIMPYDHITIRPDPFFEMQKQIEVRGEVYYPGFYTILNPNETIYDIISRAGGLKVNAFP